MPRPIHTIREGRVHLAIWKNQREGGPPYDLTLARHYKKDETWKTTYQFSAYDLDSLEMVLAEAKQFVDAESEKVDRLSLRSPPSPPRIEPSPLRPPRCGAALYIRPARRLKGSGCK